MPRDVYARTLVLVVVSLFRPKTKLPAATTITGAGARVKHIDAQIVADRLYNA